MGEPRHVGCGSFTSFPPSRRVRFAPGADIRPMPAFMSTRPAARPKTNLLKSRRSAHAGCRAVRTARSWRGIVPFTHLAREGRMTVTIGRRELLAALGGAASLFFCVNAAAQEGYYGAGHDKWHQGFYSQLRRNDGGLCCNLMDCRPTQSRIVGDHYEVKVDGVWTPVPYDKINNVVAPDGGAHVCAPRQVGPNKGVIFCVILPSEG